ncbi:MAG: DNA topoisomerase I [Nanoarchaeota archaeon]
MSYELLIAEKPNAADRISASIADGKRAVKSIKSVKYYEITRNGKTIVVVPAVGHIFGLKQKSGTWTYPVFDVEWLPTFKISKDAAYVKNYYDTLKALAKDADSFVVGTDFDIEGEVIAYNILRFICKVNDAKRMKYSTLTKAELEKSYDNASPHIERDLANAGVTRHILDYYFGINVSRALTLAMKSAGKYKIMSSGRVQGPTLKILADKELAIKAFKSTPFWQIELQAKDFSALYENEKIISQSSKLFEQGSKIEKEADAKKIVEECTGKDAIVSKVNKKTVMHKPPEPFNLTDLQTEAYRTFKLSPKMTQEIAQKLYEAALISYPRTSSQKLPAVLNLRSILENLAKQAEYAQIAKIVLSKKTLVPNEGQKTDEAHPAIHPTGEAPKSLNPYEKKVYDLVVKRFIATFGDAALNENIAAKLNIGPHIFNASGKRNVEPNWYLLYAPYSKNKDVILPPLTEGQKIDVKKLNLLAKETEPPRRYTPASIIREMERLNIGTKATRAEIVNNMVLRGYVKGTPIEVSDLGLKTSSVLEKYLPEIVSVELTRRFEDEIADIEKKKRLPKDVLSEAEAELTSELSKFRLKEKEVGGALLIALNETAAVENIVGICPACGKDLRVIVSKMTKKRFVGCSGYADGCRTSYPLPQVGMLKTTKDICKECNSPIVKIISKGKRPWILCIDPKCKTKDAWNNNKSKTVQTAVPENKATWDIASSKQKTESNRINSK